MTEFQLKYPYIVVTHLCVVNGNGDVDNYWLKEHCDILKDDKNINTVTSTGKFI